MKKLKLFLAACATMVGLSANAQLTNGTVYWIQDTGSGQFISQGGNWGTQAILQDVGGIGFEAVSVSDGVYKLKNIQFNKVVNVDKGLNIVEHDGYCDQGASDITLTASGDGYLLSAVKGSDTRYIVNNQSNNNYGVKGLGFTTNSAEATVWKFLDKAGYDAAIQAYKDAKAASYATSLGYSAANEAALEAIINDANQFISKDYTNSITNAALNAGNTDGWTATKPNQRAQAFGSENGTMAESWNGCVVATQTVSNLPNGLYKVTFVGTFRPKGSTESEKLTSAQTSSPAYVYANDSKEEFVHWIDVAAKANNRTAVKNNAASYTKAFYTYVTDGTLNLGVKQDTWYEGYMWCPFGLFTLTYYTNQVADEDITALVATIPAEESVPADVYSNLTSLKNTLESGKTIAAFNNLSSAITEANALVAPYAALLAEIAKAKALGIAAADAEAYANVTTAAEATANTQALMVDEYNYVATTYQYAVDLGAWNASDNAGTMSSQHWDGTSTSEYLEQGGGNKAYNLNSWTVTYDQNLNLPAGNYVFKVAGRTASDHVTINLNVTNVSNSNELLGTVNDFPKGDVGLGINKAGATSFDPADPAGFANNGNGRGWQWRYVKFTLTEAATVKVAVVATADAQYRWMGFCNATVQTDNEANVSLIAYNVALNNAQTVLADAAYKNVAGTDKSNLQAAIAANASLDKTDADAIDAATATLNEAATTFTAGVASWNSLVNARAAASAELPYASTSKKTALDNAVAAEATDAADAATKAADIEQANRQYVESNALAEGVDGATNVTNLITNPNADENADGWSGEFARLTSEQYTQGDGTLCGGYFDKNGASSYTAEQTIETLGTGKYLLTVTARAQSISGSYQVKATNYKGETATAAIPTIGNQGGVFGRGFNDASVEFLQTAEGNATIGITATNDANFWLSFDRVRLVKLRDLTPEELAVVPADLAIDATSTIYKGKTTTLAATSTTEGASIAGYVNWTSDNTSVATVDANGVVTGVAYGTANITVTSTLNAKATATCVVTVTAPTLDQLENLDFAEGPVHEGSIITTAADLSKPENAGAVAQMQTVTGWTITENGDNRAAGVMQYNSDYGLGGVANKVPTEGPTGTNGYALAIEAVWGTSAQYTQNVLLPAGAYKITMPIYNLIKDQNMSKNLIGFIDDTGNEYLATATNYDANKWTTETVSFVLNKDTYGKLSLGFTSGGQGNGKAPHLFIDKVQIVFEPFATAEEIAALNTAIASAEEHTLGFDKDDYAPYKNVAALKTLAAAKALVTKSPIGQSQVTEATAALTSATWTTNTEEVNAVYDGTFAAAENNGAPVGWTMSNNTLGGDKHARAFNPDTRLSEFNSSNSALFIRFDGTNSDRGSLYYYGNTVGYTMPLKAGVTYYAKADIKGWGSTGKNQRMNVTGPDGFTAVGQTLILSDNADTDDATPQQFVIVFTATVDGDYVINFQTPGGDDQKHMAVISNVELKRVPEIVLDETVAWTPTASPSANVTLKRSFNSNWATFVVPFDIDNETLKAQFGEDVQVSTISADADNLNFSAMETPAITANEPVIMKVSNTAGTYTFNNVEIKAATPTLTPIEGVQVIGNYGGQITMPASDDAAKYYYIASNKLKYTTGTQTLKGFRAYFSVAADSPVKGFFENGYDFEGLPTAIDGLQVEGANATIYNLAGQRVNKVQKGIYIVNGKKVLVK